MHFAVRVDSGVSILQGVPILFRRAYNIETLLNYSHALGSAAQMVDDRDTESEVECVELMRDERVGNSDVCIPSCSYVGVVRYA